MHANRRRIDGRLPETATSSVFGVSSDQILDSRWISALASSIAIFAAHSDHTASTLRLRAIWRQHCRRMAYGDGLSERLTVR